MKMNTQAFEARQHRTMLKAQISREINRLYGQRIKLFAMPEEERPFSPHTITEKIQALAEAGVYQMAEFAGAEGVSNDDMAWICQTMLAFVRKGGWSALAVAEKIVIQSWKARGGIMPAEVRTLLVQVKQKKNAYDAAKRPASAPLHTMHPGGRKHETLEQRRERIKRRDARRADLRNAQPAKGKSPPPPNGFKNPGGKKKK